ncbi:MAG: hypothetical protein NT154_40015 [Verrucomicrobia bacterium]|nr:hypothetical protein [Verrucomicrobiota bacterium]
MKRRSIFTLLISIAAAIPLVASAAGDVNRAQFRGPDTVGFSNNASLPDRSPSRLLSVLDYLKRISGQFTVAGIHNREPNSQPAKQTQRMLELVGRHPGLWSGDFLFSAADVSNRWTMIRECRKQWEEGSIVQLMAHVAPPNQPEVCRWIGGIPMPCIWSI